MAACSSRLSHPCTRSLCRVHASRRRRDGKLHRNSGKGFRCSAIVLVSLALLQSHRQTLHSIIPATKKQAAHSLVNNPFPQPILCPSHSSHMGFLAEQRQPVMLEARVEIELMTF